MISTKIFSSTCFQHW